MTTTTLPTVLNVRHQLERLLDAFEEHDVPKVLTFFSKDVEWTQPLAGTVVGSDKAELVLRQMFQTMPDLRFADRQLFVADDGLFAVSTWRLAGTMTGIADPPGYQPTGKTATLPGACYYRLSDGLITRHIVMYDAVDLLQQLGLMPGLESLATKLMTGVQNVSTRLAHAVHR